MFHGGYMEMERKIDTVELFYAEFGFSALKYIGNDKFDCLLYFFTPTLDFK